MSYIDEFIDDFKKDLYLRELLEDINENGLSEYVKPDILKKLQDATNIDV